jgi:hypothetical protein
LKIHSIYDKKELKRRGKMEDIYNPIKILSNTVRILYPLIKTDEMSWSYDDKIISKFHITIKIKDTQNQCYRIGMSEKGHTVLTEGSYDTGYGRIVKNFEEFVDNKDKLGEVEVRYEAKPLKEYPTYEEFWQAIK